MIIELVKVLVFFFGLGDIEGFFGCYGDFLEVLDIFNFI